MVFSFVEFLGDIMSEWDVWLGRDHEKAAVMYSKFLSDLRVLLMGPSDVDGVLERVYLPGYYVRDLHRLGSYGVLLNDDWFGRLSMLYVEGCLGHKVLGELKKSPRLCALWAGVHVGGRWREMESVISGDHLAMYMYSSKVLGGRLPNEMHNRMVMESYLEVTLPMRLYFSSWAA